MTLVRSQIVQQVRSTDVGREFCVNDVYHTVATGIVWGDPDYQNHANEVRDLFAGLASGSGSTFLLYANRGLTVKVYNMADASPRMPKAIATHTPTTWESAGLAPREVACCLSYYGDNPGVKTGRGRIYVGPFPLSVLADKVTLSVANELLDLGHGLFDIGGQNVAHVVHSPKLKTETVVHNYWVNDLWDTMRSREEREQNRYRLHP